MRYGGYSSTVEKVYKALTEEYLHPIVEEKFEQDMGYGIREALPDRQEREYVFEEGLFEATVWPKERHIGNEIFDKKLLNVNHIGASPNQYRGVGGHLEKLWWDVFGDNPNKRGHPGEPPYEVETIENWFEDLSEQIELICADPMLEYLISAIESKNNFIAGRILGLDPEDLGSRISNNELSELFINGEIHILYKDHDIALLKPEYDHDARSVRFGIGRFDRIRGQPPEPAFVVGYDDTPVGLFGHMVDGTNLRYDQSVTRDMIHESMGFDYSYQGEDIIDIGGGERVRLQGDLAIRRHSIQASIDQANRLNLPIDNHLVLLESAELVTESEQEPVWLDIPHTSAINIIHDEHVQVRAEIAPGRYMFYLLDRGIQPRNERFDWGNPETINMSRNRNQFRRQISGNVDFEGIFENVVVHDEAIEVDELIEELEDEIEDE